MASRDPLAQIEKATIVMSDVIRTFIAVEFHPTPSLRRVIEQLDVMGRPLKAVSADRLHVTLKFLGDTDRQLVSEISGILQGVARVRPAFAVKVVGIGAFPHRHRPSVIWAGLDGADALASIARELETRLEPLGFPREKRAFQPHLTLARVKSKPPNELQALFDKHESTEWGTTPIRTVEFFQSELRPEGPRYTVLASATLPETHG